MRPLLAMRAFLPTSFSSLPVRPLCLSTLSRRISPCLTAPWIPGPPSMFSSVRGVSQDPHEILEDIAFGFEHDVYDSNEARAPSLARG